MSFTEDNVIAALRDCYDPEIPLNIVDLGLVQRIALAPDLDVPGAGIAGVPQRHLLTLDLIPTGDDEGKQAQLTAQIQNRLAGIFEISRTTIHLHETPVWTPQLISREGRRILKLDQPQFPILNNRIR
ncbi:Metal-sulfur cluster biosynthetic enzyme [Granulicella rosea]|uniref:Metal-sulfur cluster biosynthetic enzyme n=1 Tax=Granulicella rosea TaxID=474952 RepID=A0A239E0H2_9BACT|nr:iron-sulfur cluster assembly protein [Granulicella rosea]SNS37881.1 Metal-sulfur cluster biosynthetic enzyme [Granulicella rosea]